MSNIHSLPTHEQSFDEASEWIAKLDRGLSDREELAFKRVMRDKPETREAVLQMAELWDKMDALTRLSDLFAEPQQKRTTKTRVAMAMAASVMVALLIGVLAISTPPIRNSSAWMAISGRAVYETAVGEHSTVNFTDGTQVVLNTNTLIRVKYTNSRRMFILERGEIHIDVAHDKSRPLTVASGDKIIQAVGTAFSVEINSDQQIELIVTDGKVLVGVDQPLHKDPILLVDSSDTEQNNTSVAVSQGEKFILEDEQQVEKIDDKEIEVKLSWRRGNLIFRGESLEEAITEISRYTSVEFSFKDKDLKDVRIAGLFKAGDVNGLLKTLRDNFNISYQRIGDERVILSSE